MKWLAAVLGVVGLLALIVAIIYFTVPAHSLPSILGTLHIRTQAHRKRRGEAAIAAAVVLWVVAGIVYAVDRRSHAPKTAAPSGAGTSTPALLARHILPNTIPALIVQGTFICASAILIEAILSFLGIGIPPETPTWGNIMAEGRGLFRLYPHNIFFPGICLALTVLAVNVLGDGLRDRLDPKLARRV